MLDITKTPLLTAEEICEKLGIARSTFDRLRRISRDTQTLSNFAEVHKTGLEAAADSVGVSAFPQPALNVLGSPRWTAEAVNRWLEENKNVKSGRTQSRAIGAVGLRSTGQIRSL